MHSSQQCIPSKIFIHFTMLLFVFVCLWSCIGSSVSYFGGCPTLHHPAHGKVRMNPRGQRNQVAAYKCGRGYTLVGEKVATCFRGHWDIQPPVCVRSGCQSISLENGDSFSTHRGAYLRFFCDPGHELVGAHALYCDGRRWNDTKPTCVKNKYEKPQLSCDFESEDICGWSTSEYHDFDWTRQSKTTPSNFMNTGPSFDHTLGEGKSGHYMYIEVTGKPENDSAMLISPVYSSELTKDGCFSIYYHMYGRHTGGLRIYQRAEGESFTPHDPKKPIFEVWHEQGDEWRRALVPLNNSTKNFEILVEGICGVSYQGDIAIDDVSVLTGENCTKLLPEVSFGSCRGRCNTLFIPDSDDHTMPGDCQCNINCFGTGQCCRDILKCFEVDLYTTDTTDKAPSESPLVPSTATKFTTSRESTTTSTSSAPKTTRSTTTTTINPVSTIKTTSKPTTPKTTVSTTVKPTTVTEKPSTRKPMTVEPTTVKPTTIKPTTMKPNTMKPTTIRVTTRKPTTTKLTTKRPSTTTTNRGMSTTTEIIETKNTGGRNAGAVVLSILLLLLCFAIIYAVYASRTTSCRVMIARIRGRTCSDPEVRYLNTEEDHDEEG